MPFCVGKYRLKADNRTAGLVHSQTTIVLSKHEINVRSQNPESFPISTMSVETKFPGCSSNFNTAVF